jgi:hypothetical protein
VARIYKLCPCQEGRWKDCPHPRVVRYRPAGGRASRQRERSFGLILAAAFCALMLSVHASAGAS